MKQTTPKNSSLAITIDQQLAINREAVHLAWAFVEKNWIHSKDPLKSLQDIYHEFKTLLQEGQ